MWNTPLRARPPTEDLEAPGGASVERFFLEWRPGRPPLCAEEDQAAAGLDQGGELGERQGKAAESHRSGWESVVAIVSGAQDLYVGTDENPRRLPQERPAPRPRLQQGDPEIWSQQREHQAG
jgi:hypothetical protein